MKKIGIKLTLATIAILGYATNSLHAQYDIYKDWVEVGKEPEKEKSKIVNIPSDKPVEKKAAKKTEPKAKPSSKENEPDLSGLFDEPKEKKDTKKSSDLPAWEQKAREKTADVGIDALKNILKEGIGLAGKAGSEAIAQYFAAKKQESDLVQKFQNAFLKMIENKVDEMNATVKKAEMDKDLKEKLTSSIAAIQDRIGLIKQMMTTKQLPAPEKLVESSELEEE
jgi:hypothetical protein